MIKKSLGFWSLLALVIGNMVGSGAFLLPSALAKYGSIGLLAWVLTTVGAICLALVFARLSRAHPSVGGPYAYCYKAYGEVLGFQVAFNYWIAIWAGNAAIAVALVGYLGYFFPVLTSNSIDKFIVATLVLWIFTAINVRGVKFAGIVQVVTAILKMLPLLLIACIGLFFIHPHQLTASFNVSGVSFFSGLTASAALTFWSFIGLESATVPADDAINPEKNIPRATVLGTVLAGVVYILGTMTIMGVVPMDVLQHSSSPYALAAYQIFGAWGGWLIAAVAVIATAGTLNGWVLLQGQVAYAAGCDNLFPKPFARLNKHGTPAFSLIVSSVLITVLLAMSCSKGLVAQFTAIILLAVLATVIPYLYSCFAEVLLMFREKQVPDKARFYKALILGGLAFVILAWSIIGVGEDVVFYWIFLMILGIPVYVWMKSG